ncbi:MAG: hypothetical protein P4L59_06255 [Desulfosporosinus sp.]|nr:hypothetical protein [Desulfosporosinus sp.]
MATTRLITHHISKGETIAQSLTDRFDYGQNPDKTQQGELILCIGSLTAYVLKTSYLISTTQSLIARKNTSIMDSDKAEIKRRQERLKAQIDIVLPKSR